MHDAGRSSDASSLFTSSISAAAAVAVAEAEAEPEAADADIIDVGVLLFVSMSEELDALLFGPCNRCV